MQIAQTLAGLAGEADILRRRWVRKSGIRQTKRKIY